MTTTQTYTDDQLIRLARSSNDCDEIAGLETLATTEEARRQIRDAWWDRYRRDNYDYNDCY